MTDWYSRACEEDGRTDDQILADHGGAASPRTEAARLLGRLTGNDAQPSLAGYRALAVDAIAALEAAQEAPAPDGLRERLRPIVADWFEKGYDAGNLSADALTDRILAATPSTPAEPPRPNHAYATSAIGSWYCCLPPGHAGDHGNYLHPDADLTGGPTCQALFPSHRAEARPPEGLDAALVRALREAILSELHALDLSIDRGYVGMAFDRAAMKVGAAARLSAGGATKP